MLRNLLVLTWMILALGGPKGVLFADDESVWNPATTRVFIVALAEFQNGRLHPFTKSERLDDRLVEIFKERGVPAGQILLLKDQQATSQNVQTEFASFLRRSRAAEILFFLFSSHGGYDPKSDRYSFYSYDSKLPFTWAFDEIERNFKGSHVALLADCCYSGGIVDIAAKRKTPIAYACLSSTYDHQTAWSGWRFIQCLNRGLAGEAVVDLDGNRQVTLEELAGYTGRYMAFAAESKPMFTTTGGFDPKLRLSGTSGNKNTRVGELIESKSGYGWAKAEILDSESDRFKIHCTKDTKTTNDTWVAAKSVRPFQFPVFPVGIAVDVQDSGGVWHPAKVLQHWESLHWCRYDSPPHVPDEWFGPSRIRPAVAGSWSGRFENDLGEKGEESLVLRQNSGASLEGIWSGVPLKGGRIGKDVLFFEAQTSNRLYRGAGRVTAERLAFDYCAHRAQGEQGKYYGWSSFSRKPGISAATRDPHSEFAGHWIGGYENSRSGSGKETLELTEKDGQLKGVWSGVSVTGERLGNSSFYLTGASGQRTYRVVGRVHQGELKLDYSATDGNDHYFGWSTLEKDLKGESGK